MIRRSFRSQRLGSFLKLPARRHQLGKGAKKRKDSKDKSAPGQLESGQRTVITPPNLGGGSDFYVPIQFSFSYEFVIDVVRQRPGSGGEGYGPNAVSILWKKSIQTP